MKKIDKIFALVFFVMFFCSLYSYQIHNLAFAKQEKIFFSSSDNSDNNKATKEICGNCIDDDMDGLVDYADPDCQYCGNGIDDPGETCETCPQDLEGCVEICGDKIDNDNDGFIDEDCEICGNLIDDDYDGLIDEGCYEYDCNNVIDDDGDGIVDNCPDIMVKNYELTVYKDKAKLNITLANLSKYETPQFLVGVFDGRQEFGKILASKKLFLGQKEEKAIELELPIVAFYSQRDLYVVADYTDSITEANEENNLMIIKKPSVKNLAIIQLTAAKKCISNNSVFSLDVIIKNVGLVYIPESFIVAVLNNGEMLTKKEVAFHE